MAQNFRRYKLTGVGSTAQDIPDGSDFDSFDTIVGIHMANTNANAITARVHYDWRNRQSGWRLLHLRCDGGLRR